MIGSQLGETASFSRKIRWIATESESLPILGFPEVVSICNVMQ